MSEEAWPAEYGAGGWLTPALHPKVLIIADKCGQYILHLIPAFRPRAGNIAHRRVISRSSASIGVRGLGPATK